MTAQAEIYGALARACGELLPLQTCQSQRGFYLGTLDRDGLPYSRESVQYWPTRETAEKARTTGMWTQRMEP